MNLLPRKQRKIFWMNCERSSIVNEYIKLLESNNHSRNFFFSHRHRHVVLVDLWKINKLRNRYNSNCFDFYAQFKTACSKAKHRRKRKRMRKISSRIKNKRCPIGMLSVVHLGSLCKPPILPLACSPLAFFLRSSCTIHEPWYEMRFSFSSVHAGTCGRSEIGSLSLQPEEPSPDSFEPIQSVLRGRTLSRND